MPLKDITITGSIGSIATQSYGQRTYISSTDDQSFPLEHLTGSYAGAWPDFVLRGLNSSNSASNTTVNLIVNVTQSWSGSNTTPLGIIPYVHNTMEEFINGEFSGSSYVVENGSLIDEQCEQFLIVNTTPTSYCMFPYTSIYFDGNPYYNVLGIFLNENTAPRAGEFLMHIISDTYTGPGYANTYITYLKVSRYDKEGNDNTLSLQELTSFRWTDYGISPFPNSAGEVVLNVENITEYPSFYLYKVKSKTWVDLNYFADDNVLDYTFEATSNSQNIDNNPYYFTLTPVTVAPGGHFSYGTFYSFYVTPNIPIQYTASLKATNTATSSINVRLGIFGTTDFNTYATITSSYYTIPATTANYPIAMSGSTTSFIGGNYQYWLEMVNGNGLTGSEVSWSFNQTSPSQSATSSVVIEPYLLSNFRNSDCDVLMNNAIENDYSGFYREVLYENGGAIPSNLQQIIDGNAEYAQINDYLYSAGANRLPRYDGVRTTSPGFNLPSQNGLSNEQLSDILVSNLSVTNGTPNVTNKQSYFLYFDNISSTNYTLLNKSTYNIKYIIDEDGNVNIPNLNSPYYYNLIDLFNYNEKINVEIYEAIGPVANLIGSKTPIRAGMEAKAIILTQTGSTPNYFPTMSFNVAQSYQLSSQTTPIAENYVIETAGEIVSYPNINLTYVNPSYDNTYVSASLSGDYIEIKKTSNAVRIYVNITADIYVPESDSEAHNTTAQYTYATYTLQKKTPSTGWTSIAVTQSAFRLGISDRIVEDGYTFGPYIPNKDTQYRWQVTGDASNISFYITQVPLPGSSALSFTGGPPRAPYWITGSNSKSVLTGSEGFNKVIYGVAYQNSVTGSDRNLIPEYTNNLLFKIEPYDQIRFEGDENQVYNILNAVITSSLNPVNSGSLYLYLDRDIVDGTNLNSFLIRRFIPNANSVILDTPYYSAQRGFLLPVYPTDKISYNFDNIIVGLVNKSLI